MKIFFSLFFFLFAALIPPSLPRFSTESLAFLFLPFSSFLSFCVETFVAAHLPIPSFERRKKASGCTFFLSSFFFFVFLIYSSLGYTDTHTYIYIQTHTLTLYIHINNGIRNDQLFVDAVRRVVGLLFFLEKKFHDQQPIIRCF